MILVDTSVWVDHLLRGNKDLVRWLNHGQVLSHPFVVGELALGSLKQRAMVLEALRNLPCVTMATDAEVLGFISTHALDGVGIGYVDAHLLAAARLTAGTQVWSMDKRLQAAATPLGLAHALSL